MSAILHPLISSSPSVANYLFFFSSNLFFLPNVSLLQVDSNSDVSGGMLTVDIPQM
jgi:hypothetical protein